MNSPDIKEIKGKLFAVRLNPPTATVAEGSLPKGKLWQREIPVANRNFSKINAAKAYKAAFAGIWLFTLVLYLRPQDFFPPLGALQLGKIVAFLTPIAYYASKAAVRERMIWPLEIKLLCLIAGLGLLFLPIAASKQDSIDALMDPLIKVVIIITLYVNVVKTREKLSSIFKLVTFCGAVLSVSAIKSYGNGEFSYAGSRASGVQGMLGNPNDLATALVLLLPHAIVLGLSANKVWRLIYFGCAALMSVGVLITYSRGGFLGLIVAAGLMAWKLGRGKRLKVALAVALLSSVMLVSLPGSYGSRISTIFNIESDTTGSAQERRELLYQAIDLALRHPIIGIGIGNFDVYSFNSHVAHNSYFEIAAELGWIGFIAYMVVTFLPITSSRRIEKLKEHSETKEDLNIYHFSIAIQAMAAAYIVVSFFASIQYQWFIYYIAAYGVALRQITGIEAADNKSQSLFALVRPGHLIHPQKNSTIGGRLWDAGKRRFHSKPNGNSSHRREAVNQLTAGKEIR